MGIIGQSFITWVKGRGRGWWGGNKDIDQVTLCPFPANATAKPTRHVICHCRWPPGRSPLPCLLMSTSISLLHRAFYLCSTLVQGDTSSHKHYKTTCFFIIRPVASSTRSLPWPDLCLPLPYSLLIADQALPNLHSFPCCCLLAKESEGIVSGHFLPQKPPKVGRPSLPFWRPLMLDFLILREVFGHKKHSTERALGPFTIAFVQVIGGECAQVSWKPRPSA